MVSHSVTFDSNVWENIVDEEKRKDQEEYLCLYNLILSDLLSPYFFVGIITMENVQREKRKKYI